LFKIRRLKMMPETCSLKCHLTRQMIYSASEGCEYIVFGYDARKLSRD